MGHKARENSILDRLIRTCGVLFLLVFLACMIPYAVNADGETILADDAGGTLSNTDTIYVIRGDGTLKNTTNYFNVPEGASSEGEPITVILDNVQYSQENKSPAHSFIHIEEDNYVVIKLRGENSVKAWSHQETLSSNDGMSGIHVSKDATVKITSEEGDGSESGSLKVYGGGGKYGGAGIGARYNKDMGTVIIAGGTIEAHGGVGAAGIGSGRNDTDGYEGDVKITGGKVSAYGGDEGAGIGSGRDGKAYSIEISGGDIYAEGGEYAAAIGAGNAVDAGSGGNLVDLTITGGKIRTLGGMDAAGIGCSDEGELEGKISISSESTDIDIISHGRGSGAAIGGGNASNLDKSDLIEIKGKGTLVAYGGKHGAGIGGGEGGGSPEIIITGDTNGVRGDRGEAPEGSRQLNVTSFAGSMTDKDRVYEGYKNTAAAIGSGKASGGNITIKNAVLETRADGQAADIGGGLYHINPSGTVNTITIENCEITSYSKFKSAPGIGAGYGGSVRNITISDTKYSGGSIGGSPMDVPYTDVNDVDSITIDNSDISAVWNEEELGPFTGGFTPSTKPQEHGAAGIGSGQYGSMDAITITDSKIVAHGFGSGSGIGAGGAGGNGFTLLDLTKWNIGDTGTIEISGSDVDAHSGTADFDEHSPIAYYDGQLFMRIENPKMFGGGAGIGGGSASNTEKVYIHNCGTVTAVGHGAGIGTGDGGGNISKGGVDYIWLENIEKLYAKAGNNSAGIGTGGSGSGINKLDAKASALKQIYIKNCADIEAYGGKWGAGIGLGGGSPCYYHIDATEKGDWPMAIIDSNVKAYGGYTGAGIGGGLEDSVLNTGGENPRLLIQGKCRIEAVGGESLVYEDGVGIHGGGAGIGGGSCGAVSLIRIDLDEDYENAAKGTYDDPSPSKYYVKATGGDGGAGIGSGGKSFEENLVNRDNADAESIDIYRGAVFAKGGRSIKIERSKVYNYYMGAGAGIGGGSYGSKIKSLYIKGGYIVAEAGQNTCDEDKADDIGAGGNPSEDPGPLYDQSNRKNGSLEILDGTVLCNKIGTFTDERKIAGGSVSAVLKDATGVVDVNGEKVYKTTAKLPKKIKNEKIDGFSTSRGYGKSHIYADNNGKIYLYLYPKGSEDDHQQWADVEVNTEEAGKNNWHYTGYTNTEHTGILKIDGAEIPFKDPGTVRWGDDFTLELDDADVDGGTEWTDIESEGSASVTEVSNNKSPGMSLKMHADSIGEYIVTGLSDYSPDSEIYWGSKAVFKGKVSKAEPTISFTNDPSKIYDTEEAEIPGVSCDSPGAVTCTFYTDEACTNKTTSSCGASENGGPPSAAGTYWVKAVSEETAVYESASAVMGFEISPAPTAVTVTLDASGASASAKADVTGLYEADGTVKFTVTKPDGTDSEEIEAELSDTDGDGVYSATITHEVVSAGEYSVKAVYSSATGNYAGSEGTAKGDKNLATREISGTFSYGKQYGDSQFDLDMSTDDPSENDSWKYEVISDSYEGYGGHSVAVDQSGRVTVEHAGKSVIRVTLSDQRNAYNDAVAYVTVTVSKTDLKVSTYAYNSSDTEKNKVSKVKYGKVDTLSFALEFDESCFKNGDSADDFTHGYGTLTASPIPETAPASDQKYEIGMTRTGAAVTINGKERKVFFSRDYNIVEDTNTYAVKVEKASLAAEVDDAEGIYAGDEPEYNWRISKDQTGFDGLASWDSAQTVFSEEPQIARTGQASGNYKSLDAGTYADCLDVTAGWTSDNYQVTFLKGTLKIDPADLSDTSRFSFEADSTEYNGRPQAQEITVSDLAFEDAKELTKGDDYDAVYPDDSRMTDAGIVTVIINGKEGSNYTGTAEATYRIRCKTVTVVTESAEKEYDGKALTAGGKIEGLIRGETAELVITGSQTEPGESQNTAEIDWNGSAKWSNYKMKSSLGKLKVTAPETVYTCVSGAGARWKHGSKKGLKFTFKRSWHDDETFDRFTGIKIDGKDVAKGDYTAEAGSVIVTLKPSFLETLNNGKHKITAVFDDGHSKDVSFSVKGKDNNGSNGSEEGENNGSNGSGNGSEGDNGGSSGSGSGGRAATGDTGEFVIWILIMMASASGICLIAILRKLGRNG